MKIRLQEFVQKTIEEINAGLPSGYVVEETIDFEVSVTTSTNKSGGVEIKVVSGEIEKGNEIVQTVYFSVVNEIDKEKSANKAGESILKWIDKGLKKLSSYSEINNQKKIQKSISKFQPAKK